jgi:putative ABC transport system permease protein
VSYPNFEDWARENRSFDSMAVYRYALLTLAGGGLVEPESVMGLEVSNGLFELLGARATLGRAFTPGEAKPGTAGVVVISHGLWHRKFGGDPAVIGRGLRVEDRAFTIIGVMGPRFQFPDSFPGEKAYAIDVWIPLQDSPDLRQREHFNYWAVGRLKDGTSLQAASSDMDVVAATLAKRYPATNRDRRIRMESLKDHLTSRVRPAMLILLAAVAALMVIAAANIAALLMSRAETRRREMAVRESLGAARGRLVRQVLTESAVLAALGAFAGTALAYFCTGLAVRIAPGNVPRIQQVELDTQVLLFTLVCAAAVGLIFGLIAAVTGFHSQPFRSLKESDTRLGVRRRSLWMRHVIVGGQIALTFTMLVTAGLLIRSFANLITVDPGFQTAQITSGLINLVGARYGDPTSQSLFFEEALRRIRALAAVESAAVSNSLPLTEVNDNGSVRIEGASQSPMANRPHVSPEYFETMGIGLIHGRLFDSRDRADSAPVAIVSEVAARAFWPNENPIGKRISINAVKGKRVWREVVGVVNSTRHFGLETPPKPEVYVEQSQSPTPFMFLVVRFRGSGSDALKACRREVAAIDPQQAIMQGGSLEEIISQAQARRRFQTATLGVFAIIALLLAAIGVYGVTAYTVSRRAREIGTRIALGAVPREMVLMIMKVGSRVLAVGMFAGLCASVALSRALSGMLFGVSALDPSTIAAVAAVLLAITGLSLYVPGRRAALVDPVAVLREE